MARTIEDLLDSIYSTSASEAEKGSRFEELIVAYLQTAGQYADRFSDVRLWQAWEGRQGEADTGIDIVATDKLTGELWAIQCKFYSPHHHLDKAHIDSFFTASGKQGFSQRLIVSTTGRWSSNAEAALVGHQIPVTRIGLADLLESDIDWEAVDFERPSILQTTTKKRLRPHQKQALHDQEAPATSPKASVSRCIQGFRDPRPWQVDHGLRYRKDVHGAEDRREVGHRAEGQADIGPVLFLVPGCVVSRCPRAGS